MPPYDAVVIVSFGGPEGPDDVIPFLENVTRGREIPRERLAVVGAHYDRFGGVSPINEQCRRLRSALQVELDAHGHDLPVYWGNRNWNPYLGDTVAAMADDGVARALAIVTSAYSSFSGCRQYLDDIEAAREQVGRRAPTIEKVRAYHDHPGFVTPFADVTREALADHPTAHVVFTAHSIPVAMASSSAYEAQLAETARLVIEAQDGTPSWSIAWQSRSGPPQVPWLEPDINDHFRALAAQGVADVVVVPIGFVSDHMEVVWDLDTEAAATASELAITMRRVATPGTVPAPAFVSMWRELIEERLSPTSPRKALGTLGIRPDRCPDDCCPSGRPAHS